MQGMDDTTARGQRGVSNRGQRLTETPMAGANPGALRMLSYAPTRLAPKSPLVVVLHGCTQNATENAAGAGWLELADRLGFAVLAPEQTASNNMNRCFNWFLGSDTQRGRGECASIAEMIEAATDLHDLDAGRVFITGLSAGGAMTAAMLATYPDLFAGGAIIAGLPYGVAHNVQEAMRAMRGAKGMDEHALVASVVDASAGLTARPFRLSIWQGDKDAVVDPSNGDALVEQWTHAKDALQMIGKDRHAERVTRTRWGDASPGGTLIELNLVHGMGHGTPLSTKRPGDVGSPAPFLLECGVSSTIEIANFWELHTSAADSLAMPPPRPPTNTARAPAASQQAHVLPPGGVAAQVMGSIERHVPKQIQDVIAQSLRSAGLMK